MINTLKKYKHFVFDVFVNTFSFTIYIISQQLLFMPFMGKILSENSFATFIIFMSIFSIISNTCGSELGIVRQIYNHQNEFEKYNKLLLYLLIFVFFISMICISFLNYSLLTSIIFSIIIVLANLRLYVSAFFRMHKNFKYVMYQNLLYLIGMIIGLLIFINIRIIWIPSMLAELFAIIFSIVNSDVKYLLKFNEKNVVDKKIIKSFKDYSIIEFLINMMTYFDKILIYPILGSNSVNVYYATTTMSKIVSLITNPLHGVLLSWINKDDKNKKNNIINITMKYCLPLVLFISLISIPLTFFAVKILYNKYLSQSLIIIIPIAIGVGFSFVSSIIKALLLKLVKSHDLLKTYIYYLFSFVGLSLIMSKYFNLFGFALANMLSRIILLLLFLILLNKLKNGDVKCETKKDKMSRKRQT